MSTKYAPLAARIVELVGGTDNIRSAFHCQTRLRFQLRDESKVDAEALAATDGVVTALSSGGMYQVVIGMHVRDVHEEVEQIIGQTDASTAESDEPRKGPISKAIDFISGTFVPVIPAIAGAGMLRAVLTLLLAFGVITTQSQTYLVLNFMADAVFFFLPVLLAFSAAVKLKCSPYLAAAIALIMVHPAWTALVAAKKPVALFDVIPLLLTNYSSTVIPILLIVIVQAPLERWLRKVIPQSLEIVLVPLLTLMIMGTLALAVIGPIGAFLGGYMGQFFTFLSNTAPWAPPLLIGALWPIMVMFGVHTAVGPLGFASLAQYGYDNIVGPGIIVSNISQGVAGLVVAFRTKDLKLKQIATAGGITGLMGITEPVLYGVNLPKKYPLVAACIGGGIGGFVAGLLHVKRFATGHSGLPALPMYLGEGTTEYLVNILIALGVASVVTAALTFFLALRFEKAPTADVPADDEMLEGVEPIYTATGDAGATTALLTRTRIEVASPATGFVLPLDQVSDPVFASGVMGPGVGINPVSGVIVAPVSGEVIVAASTGHAFGIRTADGVELLVHIGIDTVQMNGAGFTGAVAQGSSVRAGQTLVTADLDAIAAAGHPSTVVLVVTNAAALNAVDELKVDADVLAGEPVLTVAP